MWPASRARCQIDRAVFPRRHSIAGLEGLPEVRDVTETRLERDLGNGTTAPAGVAAIAGGEARLWRGMMSAEMMKCHEMMQARMDMMVGMMDQMMRHEEAQDAPH